MTNSISSRSHHSPLCWNCCASKLKSSEPVWPDCSPTLYAYSKQKRWNTRLRYNFFFNFKLCSVETTNRKIKRNINLKKKENLNKKIFPSFLFYLKPIQRALVLYNQIFSYVSVNCSVSEFKAEPPHILLIETIHFMTPPTSVTRWDQPLLTNFKRINLWPQL